MKYTPDSLFSEHIAEDGDMTSSIQKKSSTIRIQILSKHCLGPHWVNSVALQVCICDKSNGVNTV